MKKETFVSCIYNNHVELFASIDNRGVSVLTFDNKDNESFMDLRKELHTAMRRNDVQYITVNNYSTFIQTVTYLANYAYFVDYDNKVDMLKISRFLAKFDIY